MNIFYLKDAIFQEKEFSFSDIISLLCQPVIIVHVSIQHGSDVTRKFYLKSTRNPILPDKRVLLTRNPAHTGQNNIIKPKSHLNLLNFIKKTIRNQKKINPYFNAFMEKYWILFLIPILCFILENGHNICLYIFNCIFLLSETILRAFLKTKFR